VSLVERNLTLRAQPWLWSAGYGVLACLIIACAAALWRASAPELGLKRGERVSGRERTRLMALAFIPSSLLLGVTTC
jgi:hypothetical protein